MPWLSAKAKPDPLPAAPRLQFRIAILCCAGLLTPVHSALAADAHDIGLIDLSLEQLLDIKVTSVSRKEQKIADVAAAVSVIAGDELRGDGETMVADALRQVPGLDVASVNASQWAVSARGFNSVYSNKLLVQVDGRAVYTPLFAGVQWDLQQAMLDDLDRIEVIRGPGATVWGANAVNGVISVVSRDAAATQGALVYGGGGDVHQASAGMRYGGRIGDDTHYRVFGSYRQNHDYPRANGQDAGDGWQSGHAGFRMDRTRGDTHLTWQADATLSELDDHTSDAHNVNMLGRWSRQWSDRSGAEVQAYFDQTQRNDVRRAHTITDTLDFSAQHTTGLSERNDFIWGLGARYTQDRIAQTNPIVLVRDTAISQQLYSLFAQDEFHWVPERLALTAGVKLEHNTYTGLEIQPSVRMAYRPTPYQTIWSAVSRAVRTPSVAEGTGVFAFRAGAPVIGPGGAPFVPTLVGNPDLAAEVLWAYELGYRIQPDRRVSIDLAAFHNRYSRLVSFGAPKRFIPGAPAGAAETMFDNHLGAESNGGELAVSLSPLDSWHLAFSYSFLAVQIQGAPDPLALGASAPRHQAGLRSDYEITDRSNISAQLRYVDGVQDVPSYVTAGLRLSYRPASGIELSLSGENLLDGSHAEQLPRQLSLSSEVPRSIYGKLLWRFP